MPCRSGLVRVFLPYAVRWVSEIGQRSYCLCFKLQLHCSATAVAFEAADPLSPSMTRRTAIHTETWPVLSLRIMSPGGVCPLAWAASRAPGLRQLYVGRQSGLRGEELATLKARRRAAISSRLSINALHRCMETQCRCPRSFVFHMEKEMIGQSQIFFPRRAAELSLTAHIGAGVHAVGAAERLCSRQSATRGSPQQLPSIAHGLGRSPMRTDRIRFGSGPRAVPEPDRAPSRRLSDRCVFFSAAADVTQGRGGVTCLAGKRHKIIAVLH